MSDYLEGVDQEIYSCLDLSKPKSFFLFAGAGSGKTGSLVRVLQKFREKDISNLRQRGRKLAVITYTNAACDEIKRRLDFDSTFWVSTIHSFCWELIRAFQNDIRLWLEQDLKQDLKKLRQAQAKGKAGTKAAIDRERKIQSKTKRLDNLSKVRAFTYNPNGINTGRDSLNHAEVIKITAAFLESQQLLQKVLIGKYPILFIDESQDTKKELIDAFFTIQAKHSEYFSLGLFGDMMQRIYFDGKIGLGSNLPSDWLKPKKEINYRCPKRVITLINNIRGNQAQTPADFNEEGVVRLFIVDINNFPNKNEIEESVMNKMSEVSGDKSWLEPNNTKILTLEHKMAARRGGFIEFFQPLYDGKSDTTGLLDGTMSGIPFLIRVFLPMVRAIMENQEFKVAELMKAHSPLLDMHKLSKSEDKIAELERAQAAVSELKSLWDNKNNPNLIDVLNKIHTLNLLKVPDVFLPIVQRTEEDIQAPDAEKEERNEDLDAWDMALESPYSQLEAYEEYISDKSRFGTHQGVKGLEFPRVMVVLDDSESGTNFFSYEKLLGAKELSETDVKNREAGKETTLDRTRRLFYVTCSRAEKSLAIVAYTANPVLVKQYAQAEWFTSDEIIEIS